jgi:hypothetical protein
VDSAEADKVGSRRIRFCAYVGHVIDEGVRHYRTTLDALTSSVLLVQRGLSYRNRSTFWENLR